MRVFFQGHRAELAKPLGYTSVDPCIYMHGFIRFEESGTGMRWSAESFRFSFLDSVFDS